MAFRNPRRATVQAVGPDSPPQIKGLSGFERIGGGGTSTVWRANQASMNRTVAVKLIHTTLTTDADRERLADEGRRAGKLGKHPSIATVYEPGIDDAGRPYLLMEHYPHGSLSKVLGEPTRPKLSEVLAWGVQIADALEFAHSESVVHRDVKPDNILRDIFGNAVLTDFGISVDHQPGTIADPKELTYQYASPEMLRQSGVWPASDVWSLAASLYALLEGRPPFCDWDEHPDPEELGNRIMADRPLEFRQAQQVPDEVKRVLEHALKGEARDRPSAASVFADELCEAQRLLGLPVTPRTPVPRQSSKPTETAPTATPPSKPSRFAQPTQTSHTPANEAQPQQQIFDTATRPPASSVAPASPQIPQTAASAAPQVDPRFRPETRLVSPPEAPEATAAKPSPSKGKRPSLAAAGSVALVVGLAVGAYLIANALTSPSSSGNAAASSSSAVHAKTSTAPTSSAFLPQAPTHVTATVVDNGSAVELSWTNPNSSHYPVIVSLGQSSGRTPITAAADPTTVSGLTPNAPYCFAVGFVYNIEASVAYAQPVCINGGVAG